MIGVLDVSLDNLGGKKTLYSEYREEGRSAKYLTDVSDKCTEMCFSHMSISHIDVCTSVYVTSCH